MGERVKALAGVAFAMASALAATNASAQDTPRTLSVDASTPAAAPRTGFLRMGTSRAPDGRTIGVNSRYLTRDGKPWLPVMGEFHYSRVPENEWDDELAKVKAAGVDIVATYVIWSHHEREAGHFDWQGRRDLRRFVQAAARHGLLVFVRIGPWAHGEVRFGGTPEWIAQQMPTRADDPDYLGYVQRFYTQIAAQLAGELWKDGGPVIGVQLENEYNLTGPQQGAAHIATLKRLALGAGLDTPLYTVTGWDNAVFPHREVTPVFGGYPDLPWGTTPAMSPPSEVYAFRFTTRVGGDLGAQTQGGATGDADAVVDETPFLGAEYGGGLPTMYRRRPVLDPDDIAAMLPVQLGSGVNLYGYYMFHGGRNPPGDMHGQESTASGGWNDLPILNYDFQAPFGANGEAHAVLGKLRPMHAFLSEWGTLLASYPVHRPDVIPHHADDLATPRFAVRSDGERGFLFFNNHVRQHPANAQNGVRFAVKLAHRTITLPSEPVDIASGAYFVWPIAMSLGGVELRYATAQPFTRLGSPDGDVYVFRAVDGIPAEFAFEANTVRTIATSQDATIDGARVVRVNPGESLVVTAADGKRVTLVVLAEHDAERVTVLPFDGVRRLVKSDAALFESNGEIVLRSIGDATPRIGFYPPLDHAPHANLPLTDEARDGLFQSFAAHARARQIEPVVTRLREAREVPPVARGGPANAAIEPTPETFGKSAAWQIAIPADALDSLSNAYLSIRYTGDIARAFSGTTLIDDDFFTGLPWQIGLRNVSFDPKLPVTLTVLPLRRDAPVYLDARYDPRPTMKADQAASLERVTIVPEYEVRIAPR